MVHQKNDFITFQGKNYRCICADRDYAVFCGVHAHRKDKGYRTVYSEIFVCGQTLNTTISDYSRFYRGKHTLDFPNPKKPQLIRQDAGNGAIKETYCAV